MSALILAVLAVPAAVHAQDRLAPIVGKRRVDRSDRALIKAEVGERTNRLASAGTDRSRRESAREKLISTSRTKGISSAGRAAYAGACADALAGLVTKEEFETGFDAVTVLVELDHANTAPALAAALKSEHAAVRYRAARGIHSLHKQLVGDQDACLRVLRALGAAGAAENQEIVLRMVYEAMDFAASGGTPQPSAECARALNVVFESRLKRLEAAGRDELIDAAGHKAAAGCYAAAPAEEQARLIGHMERFLKHAAGRYLSADTAPGYLSTLSRLIRSTEGVIHGMIGASEKRPPTTEVRDALRRGSSRVKEEAARVALAELSTLLRGEPWNLP